MIREIRSGIASYLSRFRSYVERTVANPQAREAGVIGEPDVVDGAGGSVEIRLYAFIESHFTCEMWGLPGSVAVSDVGFSRALDRAKATGRQVVVRINSGGGDVFSGVTIANRVREAGLPVVIDGNAASIASVIAAASPHVTMQPGATLMVHNPWSCICGNSKAFRAEAIILDKLRESMLDIYVGKTREKYTREQWRVALDGEDDGADGTWLSAAECLAAGIADEAPTPENDSPTAVLLEQRLMLAELHGVKLPKNLAELPGQAVPQKPEVVPAPGVSPGVMAPGVRVSHRAGAFYIPKP